MGISFSFPFECLTTHCWDVCIGDQRAKYVRDLSKNLESLETLLHELLARRNDILFEIEAAEQRQGLKRLHIVETWLTSVSTEEIEVEKLVQDSPQQIRMLCFGGVCSRNCISSYKFGKKVVQRLNIVHDLLTRTEKDDFKKLIGHQRLSQLNYIPMDSPVGLDSTFDRVWSFIQSEEVGIIGLYGPGGVGKTTLLQQLNNKFSDTEVFVIWAIVSKGCNPDMLQEYIGNSIGFSGDLWKRKSYVAKASDIFRILDRKKFVLLLDDIWEHVNLIEMGIPNNKTNGSMIIFTTRSFQVCGQMQAHKKIMVEYLAAPEAFKLFCEKVGKDTITSDPKILQLAEVVARECAGLPLALITVARAMTGKQTPEEWENAIETLQGYATEFPDMTNKVYSRLKFSYDNLPNEMVKSCFLYCCLFRDDFILHKRDLIEYWNCEGFLEGRGEIFNCRRGFDIVGILLNACLLEKYDGMSVKMHDVTREMALWIAQEFEKDKYGFFVRAGSVLVEVPRVKEWEGARRVSFMHNNVEQLQEAPSCSHLLTLFFNCNKLSKINDKFFQCIPMLVVLDMSKNYDLDELPLEFSKMVSLEYLNLSYTSVKRLPTGIDLLSRLKYLNLEHTRIKQIPCKLSSSFQNLQVLKVINCHLINMNQNCVSETTESFFHELESLRLLNTLTITINGEVAFHKFQKSKKLQSRTPMLAFSNIEIRASILVNMEHLESLEMYYCKNIEENLDIESVKVEGIETRLQTSPDVVHFRIHGNRLDNLHSVIIRQCKDVKDLTWLVVAPNLTLLDVSYCSSLEKIINMEKLSESVNLNMFAKLESLLLMSLPILESICKYALPLPHLKQLDLSGCEKLRKLPFKSSAAKNVKFSIHEVQREWWEGLEWENEATRIAFSNRFEYYT